MKNVGILAVVIAMVAVGWFLLLSDPVGDAGVLDAGVVDRPRDGADAKPGDATAGSAPEREAMAPAPAPAVPGAAEVPPAPAAPGSDLGRGTLRLLVVYQQDRKPAAGVRVLVARAVTGWERQHSIRTDADGVVVVPNLEPGWVYAKVLHGGEKSIFIRAGRITRARLAIPQGVAVAVEVVDGDGAPIANARVWLSERWRNNRGAIAGVTDRQGRLQLAHVSPHCNVAARCVGFAPSRLYPVRGSPGGSVDVGITMQRGGGAVAGVVVDPRGEPVPGATVLIGTEDPAYAHRTGDGTWVPGPPPVMVTTAADGTFAADAAAGGRLALQVRHRDFAPWAGAVEALPGAAVPHRITLTPGAVLFGRATDESRQPVPLAFVTVGKPNSFASRRVQADRDGRFEVSGLPAGEQRARAFKKPLQAEATLALAHDARFEWNPTLRDAAANAADILAGRVVDHEDEPLPQWWVVARADVGGARSVSTRTDREGRFRVRVPWQEMRVFVQAPNAIQGFPSVVRDGVRVADGELLLRVEEASRRAGEIRGVVVDAVGAPVQARVQAWHRDQRLWREIGTEAATGSFAITDVPPGAIELKITSASHPWKKLPAQTIVAGQSIDLGQIPLQAGGRIEGSIRLAGQVPEKVTIQVFDPEGRGEAAVAEYVDGVYRTGFLAAGKYIVHVSGERIVSARHDIVVATGAITRRSFALRAAAVRTLRFTIPGGIPRPRHLSVLVHKKAGGQVWAGGIGPVGPLEVAASIAPGDYRVFVYGPGSKKWLTAPLHVADLADMDPLSFVIRPPR